MTTPQAELFAQWHFEVGDRVAVDSISYPCTGVGIVLERYFNLSPTPGTMTYGYRVRGRFLDPDGRTVPVVDDHGMWFSPGDLTRLLTETCGDDSASGWNHMICDDCWALRRPGQTPFRGTTKLLEELGASTCCYCGQDTASGIFVREDPALVHAKRERSPA